MSTFLQLCQRVRLECGIAGDGPSSVVSQVGALKKVVDRTARAWVDIQASRPFWKFLRNQMTFATVVGQREYSVVDDIGVTTLDKFDQENTYIYLTSTEDETRLAWEDYRRFRYRHRTYPDGRPTTVTEGPQRTLAFDLTPDEIYTVTLDYWMTPELLAANGDIPSLPEQYHDVIVWKSVMMFAGNETATDLFSYAKGMYTPMYLQLMLDQGELPEATPNHPIAKGKRDASIRGFS
jgi:hypothetical protein